MSDAKAKTWAGFSYVRGDGRIVTQSEPGRMCSPVPVTVVPTPRWEAMVEALRVFREHWSHQHDEDCLYRAMEHIERELPKHCDCGFFEIRAALARVDAQEESDGQLSK